ITIARHIGDACRLAFGAIGLSKTGRKTTSTRRNRSGDATAAIVQGEAALSCENTNHAINGTGTRALKTMMTVAIVLRSSFIPGRLQLTPASRGTGLGPFAAGPFCAPSRGT